MLAYCREHLADFKVPRRVEFQAALPKTPTGKLQRRQLREQVLGASPVESA